MIKYLLLFALISNAYASNCNITLYKTSATSKTAYTKSGVSVSGKVIAGLKAQCKVSTPLMSLEHKRQFDIMRVRTRLAKLMGK